MHLQEGALHEEIKHHQERQENCVCICKMLVLKDNHFQSDMG